MRSLVLTFASALLAHSALADTRISCESAGETPAKMEMRLPNKPGAPLTDVTASAYFWNGARHRNLRYEFAERDYARLRTERGRAIHSSGSLSDEIPNYLQRPDWTFDVDQRQVHQIFISLPERIKAGKPFTAEVFFYVRMTLNDLPVDGGSPFTVHCGQK